MSEKYLTFKIVDRDEDGPVYGAFFGDKQVGVIRRGWSRLGSWVLYMGNDGIHYHKTLSDAKHDAEWRFTRGIGHGPYVVLYKNTSGKLEAITSKRFPTLSDAKRYALGINSGWNPVIAKIEEGEDNG